MERSMNNFFENKPVEANLEQEDTELENLESELESVAQEINENMGELGEDDMEIYLDEKERKIKRDRFETLVAVYSFVAGSVLSYLTYNVAESYRDETLPPLQGLLESVDGKISAVAFATAVISLGAIIKKIFIDKKETKNEDIPIDQIS